MPTIARLIVLSIAVALAALGAAPVAQAATLPLAQASVSVADTPNDGVVAGGDTLVITESIRNTDSVGTLTGLTAALASQTPGVSIDQGTSAYPDIAAGATGANTTPLRVTLDPSLPCGTTLRFTLTVTNAGGSVVVPFTVATGTPGSFADHAGNPTVIGETTPSLHRVVSSVSYAGTAHVGDPGIVNEVRVNIGSLTHPNISHLALALKAPDGTTVPLVHSGRGGAGASFTNTELVPVGTPTATPLDAGSAPYTGTFEADGDLTALAGHDQAGDWRLFVTEPDGSEVGRVNSWTLRIQTASCEPRSVAELTATPNPVDPGANVVLDASASGTVDPGGITRYEWDLGDGSGFHEAATPTTAIRTLTFARGRRTIKVRVSDAGGVIGAASINLIVSFLPNAIIIPPASPKEQTSATLDGSTSNDPDGAGITTYEWDTDGDDDFNDYSGATPSVYFAAPGSHTIKLRVTDGDGAQRIATTTLNVIATTPPSPAFVATPNPVVTGQPVTLDAGGSTDDGTIVRYEWDLDGNGSYETDGGASPRVSASYPNATVMNIGVRATDDDGRIAVARGALVVNAPLGAGGGGAGGGSTPFDPGAPAPGDPGGSGGGGRGGSGGSGGSGGGGSSGGGGASAATLDAGLEGAAIQTLKLVTKKGLGLRCTADRAATCTVSASLQPADARRLGLSKSKTKPYVLGKATVRLKKAGAAVVTVRLARRALSRLKRAPRVTVVVAGKAVDGGGGQVTLRRAILIRR